jgi:hypothetical protein
VEYILFSIRTDGIFRSIFFFYFLGIWNGRRKQIHNVGWFKILERSAETCFIRSLRRLIDCPFEKDFPGQKFMELLLLSEPEKQVYIGND